MILLLALRGVSVFGCCMAAVWFDVTQVVVLFVYVDKCGWESQHAWAFHPAQTESVASCLPGVGVLVCGASMHGASTQPKLKVLPHAYRVLVCWCVVLVCTEHPPSPNWKCCPMPTGCWCVGVLLCCCVGVLLLCSASMHWTSTQPRLKVLPHAYRVLVCWCIGMLVCWCISVLVCWCMMYGCCVMLVCMEHPPSPDW